MNEELLDELDQMQRAQEQNQYSQNLGRSSSLDICSSSDIQHLSAISTISQNRESLQQQPSNPAAHAMLQAQSNSSKDSRATTFQSVNFGQFFPNIQPHALTNASLFHPSSQTIPYPPCVTQLSKIGSNSAVGASTNQTLSMLGFAKTQDENHERDHADATNWFKTAASQEVSERGSKSTPKQKLCLAFPENSRSQLQMHNKADQRNAFDEYPSDFEQEVIPEIIEAEESGNDEFSQKNILQPLPQNLPSSQIQVDFGFKMNSSQLIEDTNGGGYLLLHGQDTSDQSHQDIEAQSPLKLHSSNQLLSPQDDMFFNGKGSKQPPEQKMLKSSRSTVIAEGEHHITMSTVANNLNLEFLKSQQAQQLQYLSMDDQLLIGLGEGSQSREKSKFIKTIDWAAQSAQEFQRDLNLFQTHQENIFTNQSEHDFKHDIGDLLGEIEEEHKEEIKQQRHSSPLQSVHQSIVSINSKKLINQLEFHPIELIDYQEDDFEEEEAKSNHSATVGDQRLNLNPPVLRNRGRNSVLDEVEDDDIVNQNSSRGSSKSHSKSREQSPEFEHYQSQMSQPAASLILSTQLIINTTEELKQQEQALTSIKATPEQPKTVAATQQLSTAFQGTLSRNESSSSQSSKRRAQSRFTYFAASSISDDRWLCPICLDIFEDAVETPCCHNLFCESCIKRTPTCPLCNLRIIGQLKPNIPIRRLVMELSINCLNENCDEIVRKGEIDKHLKLCPYTPITCPNNEICGKVLRKHFDKHKNEECPYRIVECYLKCGLMLPLNDMQDHMEVDCPKMLMSCKNKCGSKVERGEMEKHINIDCPFEIVDCPNKGESLFEEGCQVRLKRKEMESHKLTCNFRRVQCPNHKCLATIIYKDLTSHDERCLFKIIDCDNRCGQKIQRQFMDKHKQECQYQMVKCPYYELGCHVETLRKNYLEHLQEEAFAHSIYFIEGQKKKNRQIDDLRVELNHLRELYDVEIQTMFLELNRVKEDMTMVRNKTGIGNQNQNNGGGPGPNGVSEACEPKIILGGNTGLGGGMLIKKDERRYENSSAGSSMGVFDIPLQRFNLYRAQQQQQKLMLSSQQNHVSSPSLLVPAQAPGSITGMMQQSIGNASNTNPLVHNLISSQQFSNVRNDNSIFLNNPFLSRPPPVPGNQSKANQSESSNRGTFSFRINDNLGDSNRLQQQEQHESSGLRNNQTFQFNSGSHQQTTQQPSHQQHNLFGENSQRGRIPILPTASSRLGANHLNGELSSSANVKEERKSANDIERKNQIALFFGSINSSQESHSHMANAVPQSANINQQLQQSYQLSATTNSIEMRDFWAGLSLKQQSQQQSTPQQQQQQQQQKQDSQIQRNEGTTDQIFQLDSGQRPQSRQQQQQQQRQMQQQQTPVISGSKSRFNTTQRTNILESDNPGRNPPIAAGARSNLIHIGNPQPGGTLQDLDSSNVLYDDDFEIEEEKHNF